jgi:hypothetical protein
MKSVLLFLLFILASTKANFIVTLMNDVHLDLQYNPKASPSSRCRSKQNDSSIYAKYGRRGCDGPKELLESTLEMMREIEPYPDVIIVPGDLVTHALPKQSGTFDVELYEEVKETIAYHAKQIALMFPNTPIVFTQGNDDYAVNYQVPNATMKKDYYRETYNYFIKRIPANKAAVTFILLC